jgi:hypothetical protein
LYVKTEENGMPIEEYFILEVVRKRDKHAPLDQLPMSSKFPLQSDTPAENLAIAILT